MIKKYKANKEDEKEFLLQVKDKIINVYCDDEEELFVNDENFLHNDVGPALRDKKGENDWAWNGIYIK